MFNIDGWSRRKFVQMGAASLAAAAPGPLAYSQGTKPRRSMMGVAYAKRNPRVAVIGTGGRGTSLLEILLSLDAQVVALCDVVRPKAEAGAAMVIKAGQKQPMLYTDGPHAYEQMLARKDIDFAVIATPWNWHAPQAICGMQNGIDVAIEVPGVTTLDECWKIVETSEGTGKHCMLLENCCYGYNETLVLRMIRAGLLGDLLYGEGAYLHDLREILFSNEGEGLWRRAEHTKRDGNLYPSHGLGPVANYMGIQRGDRFDHIVSMGSLERGLSQYRKDHVPAGDPRWTERYVTGDMNTSMIKTANGLTITVKHTVSTPRPYDRINAIAGTKGLFQDYPPRLYLDGMNTDEKWETLEKWKAYEYSLWKNNEGEAARKSGGHGGMDYVMLYRLMECLRMGLPPDMDVYDAAAWSSITPLSELSVKQGSAPIPFPDFTDGQWKNHRELSIASLA